MNIRDLPAVGVVVEVSCRYFREMGYPAPVDLGLAVEKVGGTSVIYRIGLFQGDRDEANAEGRFVHVYVDNAPGERRVVQVPEEIRAVVEPLLRT